VKQLSELTNTQLENYEKAGNTISQTASSRHTEDVNKNETCIGHFRNRNFTYLQQYQTEVFQAMLPVV
jgi:hypothetical protein